jgi:23S rRNA pseudouridine1911/1915/1917 synthase
MTKLIEHEIDDSFDRLIFRLAPEEPNARLDRFLSVQPEVMAANLSRTRLKNLIEAGQVEVDGTSVHSASLTVRGGQVIALKIPPASDPLPGPEKIPLRIVFEDSHLIVIDKPAGLVVHPAAGHGTGTLVNALIHHCGESLSGIGGVKRPGIVHRLDKDTSGLLVVAKTDAAHRGLAKIFADHGKNLPLIREYSAFVWGVPDRSFGVVETYLGRHPTNREKIAVVSEAKGRHAVTHWRKLKEFLRGPIRSASIWRISVTRCWAIRPMARAFNRKPCNYRQERKPRWKSSGGRLCTRRFSAFHIPSPMKSFVLKVLCQRISPSFRQLWSGRIMV